MKIRAGFVSNSSSSSFLVLYEIDYNEELKKYIEDELGKYGVRVASKYILDKDGLGSEFSEMGIDFSELEVEINDNKKYILTSRIAWTNEGGGEGEECWLADRLLSKHKREIYRTGEY